MTTRCLRCQCLPYTEPTPTSTGSLPCSETSAVVLCAPELSARAQERSPSGACWVLLHHNHSLLLAHSPPTTQTTLSLSVPRPSPSSVLVLGVLAPKQLQASPHLHLKLRFSRRSRARPGIVQVTNRYCQPTMGTIPSAGTPHSVPTARSLRGDAELDKAEQPQAVADHNNNEGQVITKRCIKGKGKQDDVDITLVTLPAQPLPVTSIPLDELAPPTAPSQQPLDTNSATPTSLNVAPTPRPTRSKSVVLDVPPRPPLVHHLSDKSATTDHLPASSPGLPPLTASQSATAGGGAGNTSSSFNSGITTGMRSWKSSGRGNIDKKRLAALGFEEELTRDFDFWASFGLTLCNIGGFPGESDVLPFLPCPPPSSLVPPQRSPSSVSRS